MLLWLVYDKLRILDVMSWEWCWIGTVIELRWWLGIGLRLLVSFRFDAIVRFECWCLCFKVLFWVGMKLIWLFKQRFPTKCLRTWGEHELTRVGFRFEDFNHFSVFAKWIQESFGDAQKTLAKTQWKCYNHFGKLTWDVKSFKCLKCSKNFWFRKECCTRCFKLFWRLVIDLA